MHDSSGTKTMSQRTFERFKNYIEGNIGIQIPQAKKVMVESRLLKRLRLLKLSSFGEYEEYFFTIEGQENEAPRFIEAITTNKTDFFREIDHFDILYNKALPEVVKHLDNNEIRLWSAASSTGEEAYTMAMFVEEFLHNNPGYRYKILATDISEKVLDHGRRAVYPLIDGKPIPMDFKKKYCLISKEREEPTLRIKKKLRDRVMFRQINLTSDSYKVKKVYHIIFLRNVMIYFNKDTQREILFNLNTHLHDKGYLFLGHSENLPGRDIPFERIGPSVYIKKR